MVLLFTKHLLAFLTSTDEVGHDLVSGSEGQILVNAVALSRQGPSDLVTESLELTEANTFSVFEVSLVEQVFGEVDGILVVGSYEQGAVFVG